MLRPLLSALGACAALVACADATPARCHAPADASCPAPLPRCADARPGAPCERGAAPCPGCNLSAAAHFEQLECAAAPDGGARWTAVRGTPDPACRAQ